jgi:hypothetical protein
VIQNPDDLPGVIHRESEAVLSGIDITKPVARTRASAHQLTLKLRRTASILRGGDTRLGIRLGAKLVGRLTSSDHQVQTEAANQLLNLDDEAVTRRVIEQLLSTMRSDRLPAKVNAARVIGEVGPYERGYITSDEIKEAKSICGCH